MAEADFVQQGDELGALTVLLEDVEVVYRVYQDRRAGLREIVARRGAPRPSIEIHALRGVSLTACQGEAIGVVGRNGSGKSTLMQAIAGALPVTRGRVLASGQPMLLGVGAALKPNLSGERNVTIGLLALGLSRQQVREVHPEVVEFSGLGEALHRPMRTYSSGMRARLHFAISTAVVPEILLLDEALAVGDREFKMRSRERIDQLRAEAGTVFLVSHDLKEIEDSCQRAIWLHDGRIARDGVVTEVLDAYQQSTGGG